MKIKHETPAIVVKYTRVCDFCKGVSPEGDKLPCLRERVQPCLICGRDVCRRCSGAYDSEYLEPDHYIGDNPSYVCNECWEIGKKYTKQILELRNNMSEIENELMDKWTEQAKAKALNTMDTL